MRHRRLCRTSCRLRCRCESGAFGAVVAAKAFEQGCFVRGKVLIHAERSIQADQGDEVGRLHLLVDVVLRRLHGAVDVFGLHTAQVEEHDDQTMVLQLAGVRGKIVIQKFGDGRLARYCRVFVEDCGFVNVLVVEACDGLGLSVLEDGKVAGFQGL